MLSATVTPTPTHLLLTTDSLNLAPLYLTDSYGPLENNAVARFTGGNTDWEQAWTDQTMPTATINWGDGQIDAKQTIVFPENADTLSVIGVSDHRYTKPGAYVIGVTLSQNGQIIGESANVQTVSTTTAGGRKLTALVNHSFKGKLGTFTLNSTSSVPLPADPTAKTNIDWGDGSLDTVNRRIALTQLSGLHRYAIRASHKYTHRGNYVVEVWTYYPTPTIGEVAEFIPPPELISTMKVR
jgi:hypothetical protein